MTDAMLAALDDEADETKPSLSLRERRKAKLNDIMTNGPNARKHITNVVKEGIAAHYNLGSPLDQGTNHLVYRATKVGEGQEAQEYIVKARPRSRYTQSEDGWRSVMEAILNNPKDQHCLSIEAVLMDMENFYVVTKLMQGGELRDFLIAETEVPEPEVKRIIREILLALKHLHDLGMIHRDVKPENILFEKYGESLKLMDFDLCQPWSPESPSSRTVVGTPGFIAPECLLGDFSPLSDLWSVGVIFYVLMVGDLPYSVELTTRNADYECKSPKSRSTYRKICEQVVNWEGHPWPQFPEGKDLCQRLLNVSAENRMQSAAAALEHPFLLVT